MNTEKILEGLRAAKTAFQETLDYCKKDGVDCQMIYNCAWHNNTEFGICNFLSISGFETAMGLVKNIFGFEFLISPLSHFKYEDKGGVEQCIESTTKRVEWLESKIKELEANQ